jgi:hypothetical protein
VGIRDRQPPALEAPFDQAAQERRPESSILRGARVHAQNLTFALQADPDHNNHRRHRLHPTVLPHLVVRGIDSHVGVLPLDRPVRKASTSASRPTQIRDTSDFDIPSRLRAVSISSTLRADIPWTQASWTTACSALSALRRGSRSDRKQLPVRTRTPFPPPPGTLTSFLVVVDLVREDQPL